MIEYLANKYGSNHCSFVGNRLVYSPKSAVRDLGQVWGVPAFETQKATKEYNADLDVEGNIKRSKAVREFFGAHPELAPRVDRLTGTVSALSIHAGGVLLSRADASVRDNVALQRTQAEGRVATLWTKDEVAGLGFIKYDILGLTAAGVVHAARESLGLDPYEDAAEEPEVFQDVVLGNKHRNIFQFETQIGQKAFADLMPRSIMEIANASSILRVIGSGSGRELYATYKQAVEQVQLGDDKWWRDRLKDELDDGFVRSTCERVLASTYGVLMYQEQLANLVVELSGGRKTFVDGNRFRKLLDKHKKKHGTVDECQGDKDLLQKWHADFMVLLHEFVLPFAGKDGLDTEDSVLRRFLDFKLNTDNMLPVPTRGLVGWIISASAYLFSVLHAIAYSVNTYNTMWLKHHHPLEFWTAYLACERGDSDKVRGIISAITAESAGKIEVTPPDVNLSGVDFTPIADGKGGGKLVFGLGSIAGIGKAALAIIAEREAKGKFKDLKDFYTRSKAMRAVTRKTLWVLAMSGAFSGFGELEEVLAGFDKIGADIEAAPDNQTDMAKLEAKLLGVNLTFAHPIERTAGNYVPLTDLVDGATETVAVRIVKVFKKLTKKGKPYCMYRIQCLNSGASANVFDWFNKDLAADDCHVFRLSKRNDFIQLAGSSGGGGGGFDRSKLRAAAKKPRT